jgi:hypothetical protein
VLKPSRKRKRPYHWAVAIVLCSSLPAATPETPAQALFNHVREKVIASVKNAPRYTCVETVERKTFIPRLKQRGACQNIERGAALVLDTRDHLRLDVGVSGGREIYSWHGEKQFHDTGLDDLVGYGPIGSGMFSTFLAAIFGTARGHYLFTGTVNQDGYRRAEFNFTMPQKVSDYEVHSGQMHFITGYTGGFSVNWTSGDLLSLRTVTDQLPRETNLCSIEIRTNYRQVELGGSVFLLPGEVITTMLQRDGGQQETQTKYEDCRTFSGEATLHFDGSASPSDPQGTQGSRIKDLPRGLLLRIRLASKIDAKSNWVGDPVEGTLDQPLRRNKVLIAPKGARVEGRITRLLAVELPAPSLEVGLEWRRIIAGAVTYRVSARLMQEIGLGQPHRGQIRFSYFDDRDNRMSNYIVVTGKDLSLDRRFVANWRSVRPAEKN